MMKTDYIISVVFIALLLLTSVETQEEEGCGVTKRKCSNDQYCLRPDVPVDYGVCVNYRTKNMTCTKELLCEPQLECKEKKVPGNLRYGKCQDPSV